MGFARISVNRGGVTESMRMSYIQEFVSCAQHLNMRAAANELLMTQSNLSKHIKQLETEVGAPLFTYASNRLSLTPAGLHFLKGSLPLLDAYENLQEGCYALDEAERHSETRQLIAQQHSLVDETAFWYYRLIDSLKDIRPEIHVSFAKASRRIFLHELHTGNINLCLDYRFGSVEAIQQDYQGKGIISHHLCSEPVAIWCDKDHFLNNPHVTPADLLNIPIMTPGDAAAPMKLATTELCHAFGFEPNFVTAPTTSQPEFLNSHTSSAIYLYPYSFTQTPLLKAFENMAAVLFDSPAISVESFAIADIGVLDSFPELAEFLSTE